MSGFKQRSNFNPSSPSGEAGVDAASPTAGVCGVVLGTGRYRERAGAQKWCIDYGVCGVRCSTNAKGEVFPSNLDDTRVLNSCLGSGTGDVLDVPVAKCDVLSSQLDEASAVVVRAQPSCAGPSSARGGLPKFGRPSVNSRVMDRVSRLSFMNSSGESSRACMSYFDALLSAPARAPAAALVARCSAPLSAAVGLCMHDGGTLVPDACSNSWSDTGSTQVPTGRRSTKGGVSGPAEDLRRVSEVEAGVNFRPAGSVRGQDAGSHFPVCNQAQVPGGPGKVRVHLASTRRFLLKPHGRGFGC